MISTLFSIFCFTTGISSLSHLPQYKIHLHSFGIIVPDTKTQPWISDRLQGLPVCFLNRYDPASLPESRKRSLRQWYCELIYNDQSYFRSGDLFFIHPIFNSFSTQVHVSGRLDNYQLSSLPFHFSHVS